MSYATRSNIEDAFGVTNVEVWADLDADEDSTKITNRITRALAIAEEEVDESLRNGAYVVPVTMDVDGVLGVSVTLTDVTAKLAGGWLWENRRLEDTDKDEDSSRVSSHAKRARAILTEIASGKRKLNAYRQDDDVLAPSADTQTLTRDDD